MTLVAVAAAGAAGAALRYALGRAVGVQAFPWTTLAINVGGSVALAYLLAGPLRARLSETATIALAVGFLGAFTTFSTFGYETVILLHTGRAPAAAAYVSASLVLGVGGSAAGYALARAG